ncbi:MAG: protein-glutamate O-methyltransferase CheR [Euryarchaeota archaeon]|nr:protein-glutamate O-methyltransferase CheR [Euryarchaeota archaeon]
MARQFFAVSEVDVGRVVARLSELSGVELGGYRGSFLQNRLLRRLLVRRAGSVADYLGMLEEPGEQRAFLSDLSLGVSRFFRDAPVLRCFEEQVVPRAAGAPVLRVWSAGCASGEEPYTLSMLLREARRRGCVSRFRVLGSDIDREGLSRARAAWYGPERVREVPPALRESCFEPRGEGFRVRAEVREPVEFVRSDVTRGVPFRRLDVIFFRNVAIYLARDVLGRVHREFHRALNPGGYLVLGQAEGLAPEARGLFEAVDLGARIYRAVPAGA